MATTEPTNLVASSEVLDDVRDRVRDQLADSYARTEINLEELERRLDLLWSAQDVDSVEQLVGDLPSAAPLGLQPASAIPTLTPAPLSASPETASINVVLGEAQRNGIWIPARHNRVRAILAAVTIDLREAQLAHGTTIFDLNVVLGEVAFLVPPGLPLTMQCDVILAEVGDHRSSAPPRTGAARVLVTGRAVLGQIVIVERLPGEGWLASKRRRRLERKNRRSDRKKQLGAGSP